MLKTRDRAIRRLPWLVPLLLLLGAGCARSLTYVAVLPDEAGVVGSAAEGRESGDRPEEGSAEEAASRPAAGSPVWRGTVHRRAAKPAAREETRAAVEPEAVEAAGGAGFVLAENERGWAWPVIGNGEIDGEVGRLPEKAFREVQAGLFERVGCWRFRTMDGAAWPAERWTLGAVLSDRLLLRERGTRASQVIDAQDLLWIESPRTFPVQVGDRTLHARRVTLEAGKRIITDAYGTDVVVAVGEARYAPPKGAPPDEVYGVDREGRAWPIDLAVIRGFIEMDDTSVIVLGSYRTIAMDEIARWEFDKEWGPWSYALSPYLAVRRLLTNKDYVARCERLP